MSEDKIPAAVTQQAQEMAEAIGLPPSVEQVRQNRWRIGFSNDRVAVTVDYRVFPQLEWAGSTLVIDGQPRRLADDLDHLARFFKDTTATLEERHLPVVIPEDDDHSSAPSVVRHMYAIFRLFAHRSDAVETRITRTDRGGWCVGLYTEKHLIELNFTRRNHKWAGSRHQPFRLVVENDDVTSEVKSLEEALRFFLGGGRQEIDGRQPIGRTQDVRGPSNAVLVRRASVIRN